MDKNYTRSTKVGEEVTFQNHVLIFRNKSRNDEKLMKISYCVLMAPMIRYVAD